MEPRPPQSVSPASEPRPESPEPWPESVSLTLRRRTQGRHIVFGAKLLGIGPDIDEREREHIARVLDVPCLILNDAAKTFRSARLYVNKASVVADVLRRLRPHRGLNDHLLAAGVIAGLFGAPLRWDPGGIEHKSRFRRFATAP